MTQLAWQGLLEQYGQAVTLHQGDKVQTAKAFLQPIRETKQEQLPPSPLGLRRDDRFLYLGSPSFPLQQEDWVEGNGTSYDIWATHLVYLGTSPLYTWAVLRPRDAQQEETT